MIPGSTAARAPKRLLALVVAVLFLAAAYFYQDPEWNGNSRLDLTRAIVEEGTLQIDAYQSQANWATEDKASYGGHYYADKAIGSSLLAAPVYFLLFRMAGAFGLTLSSAFAKHVLTTIVVGGAFTLTGTSMYLIADQIMGNAWQALVPTLALAFGTMLWPYSAVFYGHVIAAGFLALSFYLVFSERELPGGIPTAHLFWAAMAAGWAIITEYTCALVVAGLVVYAVYLMRQCGLAGWVRAGVSAALGALIPLSMMCAYNWAVYGNPATTGYAYEVEDQFREGMSLGFMGLHLPNLTNLYRITLDPQFGLFWQSPILVLALVGFVMVLRRRQYRAEGLLCLFAVAAMLAMNAGYYLWWGGSAFGPRLLIPALPFFIVPLAALPGALLWGTAALGAVSATNMLIPLMGQIQPTRLVFRLHRDMFYVDDAPFTGFSLLYDYGLPQIFRQYASGNLPWTLGTALGLPAWLSLPALAVTEAALFLGFYRRRRRDSADPRRGPESRG
jgi:hypothetical protein